MKSTLSLFCLLFLALLLSVFSPLMAAQLVAGAQTYTSTFGSGGYTVVPLSPAFDQTPVVFVLPTTQGGDPSNVRIRTIGTSSFEAAPTEPHREDGPHVAMQSTSIAVDKGNFILPTTPNPTKFEVGTVITSAEQFGEAIEATYGPSAWQQVTFNVPFSSPPIVIATIQTLNNEEGEGSPIQFPPNVSSLPFLDVAISDLTNTGFKVALERSEAEDGEVTQDEIIGYMAMEAATGTFVDGNGATITFKAFSYGGALGHTDTCVTNTFPNGAFSSTPIVVASKRSRNNPDGGWVRRCSLSSSQIGIEIDEDRETEGDDERSLSAADAEDISVIAFSSGFVLGSLETFVPTFAVVKQSQTLSDPVNGGISNNPKAIPGAIIEYSITVTNTGQGAAQDGTFVVDDAIPANTSLVVSGLSCGGAVEIVPGSPSSGLTCDTVEFAQADGIFGYSPTPAVPNNTDANVRFIRIKPSNEFNASTVANPSPSITFKFRVELN